jgi:signal transduction histidine kinase
MILFLNDITEDYRIRQALILNEKRATLGEFIATVTHGLGNNMMNIIANASGVQDELARLIDRLDTFAASPEGSSSGFQAVKSDVADIRAGLVDYCERLVRRAFEMDRNIKSLFEYGRQQTEIRVPTEINMVMDDAAAVVQSYPCNNVVWVRNLAADLPTVIVNPHKIKDAVVDLMLNAVQAIPAGAAGRVEYETALDPDRRQIMVRIRDTGPGIPPEHRAMMFKAFFTTKRSGTGLGLANVKNVVKQHDGEVGFDCPPGGGTMFQFSLPIR